MATTSQFGTPSTLTSFGGSLILFRGNNPDKNGTHQIQVLTAPIPPGSGAGGAPRTPSFSAAQMTDQTGVGITDGVITYIAARGPPLAINVDEKTIELIYNETYKGYMLLGQSFTMNGTARSAGPDSRFPTRIQPIMSRQIPN